MERRLRFVELGKFHCKKCHKNGDLFVEIKKVGDNLQFNYYIKHELISAPHFVGRKILRTISEKREDRTSFSFG